LLVAISHPSGRIVYNLGVAGAAGHQFAPKVATTDAVAEKVNEGRLQFRGNPPSGMNMSILVQALNRDSGQHPVVKPKAVIVLAYQCAMHPGIQPPIVSTDSGDGDFASRTTLQRLIVS